jgi:predicted membrane protein
MEPTPENQPNNRQLRRLLLGVVVILAGLLLLGVKINILPWNIQHIFFSWQMLLIVIGVGSLMISENRLPGLILITIGGFFLIPRIFIFPFNYWGMLWPILLILIGIFILFRKISLPRWRKKEITDQVREGFINEDCIFSGTKKRIMHQVFHGGTINCVFGGVDLDLTQALQAEGTTELDINVIFGGVNIIVPYDWKVNLKTTAILGGFTDKRTLIKEPADPGKILIIKGGIIFGGGEIKSY